MLGMTQMREALPRMTQMRLGFAGLSSNEAPLAEIDHNVGNSSKARHIWDIPSKHSSHLRHSQQPHPHLGKSQQVPAHLRHSQQPHTAFTSFSALHLTPTRTIPKTTQVAFSFKSTPTVSIHVPTTMLRPKLCRTYEPQINHAQKRDHPVNLDGPLRTL